MREDDHRRDRRRVAALVALPVLCLVVGIAAWWLGSGATHTEHKAPDDGAEAAEARARIDAAMEDAHPSSTKGFLADLAQLAGARAQRGTSSAPETNEGADVAPADGAYAVSWEAAEPVNQLAAAVLEAYRAAASTQLATSGYLDLKGNVWGAVIQSDEWVDVVVVAASGEEDADERATARVVRLVASAP